MIGRIRTDFDRILFLCIKLRKCFAVCEVKVRKIPVFQKDDDIFYGIVFIHSSHSLFTSPCFERERMPVGIMKLYGKIQRIIFDCCEGHHEAVFIRMIPMPPAEIPEINPVDCKALVKCMRIGFKVYFHIFDHAVSLFGAVIQIVQHIKHLIRSLIRNLTVRCFCNNFSRFTGIHIRTAVPEVKIFIIPVSEQTYDMLDRKPFFHSSYPLYIRFTADRL